MVDIEPVQELKETVSLDSVRNEPSLTEMPLIRRGQRLSIQPVQQNEFETICAMGGLDAGEFNG
jgi:predicted RNA-binding protein with PUA-like domain